MAREPSSNAPFAAVTDVARAKVNLTLHVTGQRPDGYHLLDSLIFFPNFGDALSVRRTAGAQDALQITGPFGSALSSTVTAENLVIKAAKAYLKAADLPIETLDCILAKNLPVAAGIGGGSADAAAMLRVMHRLFEGQISRRRLSEVALSLGADVPMCLKQRPVRVQGIGDNISPLKRTPNFSLVLVNPGVAVSTPEVFRVLRKKHKAPMTPPPDTGFATVQELVHYVRTGRNDLEEPASQLAPVINQALDELKRLPSILLARMSGSGATCFAITQTLAQAQACAASLNSRRPNWWCVAAQVPAIAPPQ